MSPSLFAPVVLLADKWILKSKAILCPDDGLQAGRSRYPHSPKLLEARLWSSTRGGQAQGALRL